VLVWLTKAVFARKFTLQYVALMAKTMLTNVKQSVWALKLLQEETVPQQPLAVCVKKSMTQFVGAMVKLMGMNVKQSVWALKLLQEETVP